MKAVPIRRDWLRESEKIASGDKKIKASKEHVKACWAMIMALKTEVDKYNAVYSRAFKIASEDRRKQGLPIPIKTGKETPQ